jgi:hypothetical protein
VSLSDIPTSSLSGLNRAYVPASDKVREYESSWKAASLNDSKQSASKRCLLRTPLWRKLPERSCSLFSESRHRGHEFHRFHGLGQEDLEPGTQRLDSILHAGVGRQCRGRYLAAPVAGLALSCSRRA